MKKTVIQLAATLMMITGCLPELSAQCQFTGLAPAYCRDAAAVSLTASTGGGFFYGPGIVGSSFSPSLAGGGTHTVSYGICTNTYNITQGVFAPISTTSGANGVSLTDDSYTSNLPIGFSFRFFCNSYTDFYICSNGWMSFSAPNSPTYPGQFMPTGTTPDNMIAFAWADLNPGTGGTISYTTVGTQPNRRLLVTFTSVNHFGSGVPVTVQVQLHETTNIIEIHTTTMTNNGTSHTMGIQNVGSSVAWVVPGRNANSSWSASNEMYQFSPALNCVSSQTVFVDSTVLGVTGPSTLCLHSTASFTASGTSTYSWTNFSTGAVLTVTPPAGVSVYTVSGQAPGNLNCVYSTPFTLTVQQVPVNAVSSTTLLCVGSTATLTGSGASTYSWNTGATAVTATVDPVVNTTYTLWGTSAQGCVEQYTIDQAVNTNTLSISSDTQVCMGKGITLSAGNANSYMWSTGSPFASITVTPAVLTTYSVDGVDQYNCHLEASVTVTVNPLPSVTLNTPKTKVCKGDLMVLTAAGAATYSWSTPPGGSGTTMTVIPQIDVPHTFTVQGTDANGCRDDASVIITVDRCVGLAEIPRALTFDIYPNPASSNVIIRVPDKKTKYRADVFNSVGALIHSAELHQELNDIDLNTLAKGVYMIRISDSSAVVQVSRLVKD